MGLRAAYAAPVLTRRLLRSLDQGLLTHGEPCGVVECFYSFKTGVAYASGVWRGGESFKYFKTGVACARGVSSNKVVRKQPPKVHRFSFKSLKVA